MARKKSSPLNAVSAKLTRLLNMQYRPSELADELGIDITVIYKSYIPLGCPHTKDDTGHLWIVGTEFRQWFKRNKLKANKGKEE